jgi:hypothetical protein
MRTFWGAQLGHAHVAYCEDETGPFVITKFYDGTSVMSRPEDDSWDWRHDVLHSCLAAYHGWGVSPTLWRMAHLKSSAVCSDDFVAQEEAVVLRLQEALCAA